MRDIANASRQVATKSAMNPILWMSAVVTPVSLILTNFAAAPFSYLLLAIACLPVIVGCWIFTHFARNDPDRLQSESHIEHMEMLSRIGDNAIGSQRTIENSSEILIGNVNPDSREEGRA